MLFRSGKVLLFVDPNAESSSAIANMGGMGSTGRGDKHALDGIKKLMSSWGVQMAEDKVIGDIDNAVRINMSSNNRPVLSDYVAWMRINSENFDANDAVIGDLKVVMFGTPGALEAVQGATTKMTPLLKDYKHLGEWLEGLWSPPTSDLESGERDYRLLHTAKDLVEYCTLYQIGRAHV